MTALWLSAAKAFFAVAVILWAAALLWRSGGARLLVAAWMIVAFILSLASWWTWAVYSDPDNLEHGLRPDRLLIPILLSAGALVAALWWSVRWMRRAGTSDAAA